MSDELKTTVVEDEDQVTDVESSNDETSVDTPIYSQDPFQTNNHKMVKTLRVGDRDVIVEGYYAYCYNYGDGKHVLRFNVMESDHSFEELQEIFKDPNMPETIEYRENDQTKEIRVGYTRDFETKYSGGMFSCEITQVTETELRVAKTEKSLIAQQENTDIAIAELTSLVFEAMTAAASTD